VNQILFFSYVSFKVQRQIKAKIFKNKNTYDFFLKHTKLPFCKFIMYIEKKKKTFLINLNEVSTYLLPLLSLADLRRLKRGFHFLLIGSLLDFGSDICRNNGTGISQTVQTDAFTIKFFSSKYAHTQTEIVYLVGIIKRYLLSLATSFISTAPLNQHQRLSLNRTKKKSRARLFFLLRSCLVREFQ